MSGPSRAVGGVGCYTKRRVWGRAGSDQSMWRDPGEARGARQAGHGGARHGAEEREREEGARAGIENTDRHNRKRESEGGS